MEFHRDTFLTIVKLFDKPIFSKQFTYLPKDKDIRSPVYLLEKGMSVSTERQTPNF